MTRNKIGAVVAVVLMIAPAAAIASETFAFDILSDEFHASGTLTTGDANMDGSLPLLSIDGIDFINSLGHAVLITGLSDSYGGPDNVIFNTPPGVYPYPTANTTHNGFSFVTDGTNVTNVFFTGFYGLIGPDLREFNSYTNLGKSNARPVSFTLYPFSVGVPEPATWALMIVGFGAIGTAMRGRSNAKVSYV